MNDAAQRLLGQHDFRCFESEWPNKATSVRTILDAGFTPLDRWSGWSPCELSIAKADHHEFLCFEIEADGFLYNMVRAIVGTLVKGCTWCTFDTRETQNDRPAPD